MAIAEPLVFHWSQSRLKVNTDKPAATKTILRSSQQKPVDLQSPATIRVFARARQPGRLKCNLRICHLDSDRQPDDGEESTGCTWSLSQGATLQATLHVTQFNNISVTAMSADGFIPASDTGLMIVPATHEVPLDTDNLKWLEEFTVMITSEHDYVFRKSYSHKICTHMQLVSGQLFQLQASDKLNLNFRPRFFSIFIDPDIYYNESAQTEKLASHILEWELTYLNIQLKALMEKEIPVPISQFPDFKINLRDEGDIPIPDLIRLFQYNLNLFNHYFETEKKSPKREHRYHIHTPVYPLVTTEASLQCRSKKNDPLHVDSWGELSGSDVIQEVTQKLKTVIADVGEYSHNQRIARQTYPAIILDTDLRKGLVGQLGLFARRHLPRHTCLGAYGGILLHKSELELFDHFFGSQVDDYIHETGHHVDKKLLISPYQTGNLLSLANTDRLREDQPDEDHPRNITKINLRAYGVSYVVFTTQTIVQKDAELLIEYGPGFLKNLQQLPDDFNISDNDNASIITLSSEASESFCSLPDLDAGEDTTRERCSAKDRSDNPYRRNNYQCLYCDQKKDPYEIVYHHLTCHNEPVFLCPNWHCFSVFKINDIDEYIQHRSASKADNQLNSTLCCEQPDCHYATDRRDLFQNHTKEPHHKPVALQAAFRQECHIIQQWKVHWTQLGKGIVSNYNCPLCDKSPDSKEKLVKHLSSNHATPCMSCPTAGCSSIFSVPEYWFYHVKMIRSVGTKLGLKVCATENCHHIFARKGVGHSCKVKEWPNILPASCPSSACKETFYSKKQAQEHIDNMRAHPKDSQLCEGSPLCHISARNPSRLQRHNGGGCRSSRYFFERIPAKFYRQKPKLIRRKSTIQLLKAWKTAQKEQLRLSNKSNMRKMTTSIKIKKTKSY